MHLTIIDLIYDSLRRGFKNILDFYLFSISIMGRMIEFFRLKGIGRIVLLRQIMFTGSDALLPIGFISLSTSVLVILEVHQVMGQLGKGQLLYELMVLVVIRQLSSLFTAFVVIARSGSSISTEIGNMVIHKEIDLLDSFGISPLTYLVVPRMLGVIISLFSLTLYFNLVAIVGGALFANIFYDFNFTYFMNRLIGELTYADLFVPVFKAALFGAVVGLISCFQGLKVKTASTEVPQQTMHAVAASVVAVITLNVGITAFFI